MRHHLLFLLLIPTLLFSQRIPIEKVDSVSHYIELVKFNKNINNYRNCLDYSQKALDYAKKTNNQKSIANSYSNLGIVYLELKKYNDAIDVLIKSIAIYSTLPQSSEQAFAYYSLGVCYIQKNNIKMAEKNFNVASTIYKNIKVSNAEEMLNLQKGIVLKEKGRIDLAMPLFESVISNSTSEESEKTKSEALYQIGRIEQDKKRFNLAINYFNRALKIESIDIEQKSNIILALSESYEKSMNLVKSHDLLKQHLKLRDSINSQNNKKIGLEDFASFKESEKLKLIEQIDKENKTQEKANIFAKLISILAIALISILSLLSLSLYKNNILRTQSNTLLKEKNRELEIAKENAEKASKARAEFLSTVSHELRTPLNAINGITHLLIEEKPKASQINYLNSLKFSGNYLLTFINDILEINRIESENVPVESINCDLKVQLLNIQNSFKEIAQENNNNFILDIDETIPNNLICDPTKLSQIFINLVNNSLKFTKNGYVNLSAKLVASEGKKVQIHFKVSDNGIGIPDDKQLEIFDSFSQGSIEINRKYGGTGLGLSIVKRLIELLGGVIELNSKVGLGTTFSFTLPFEVGEKSALFKPEKIFDKTLVVNKKILLVEDNKINQMITKKMLENKGMSCHIVDNGEQSVELMKEEHEFDLILMDVHLPGINGTIATQKIREFNQKTPIIALTAISLNENREMLLSYGMTDVITKPFEPDNFYSIIADNLKSL
ncbi:tetratricopeptide repeat-containing hybrid sensor histidine kinase/response regulator [Flavobacterium aquatile]|uniref:histidine kinase n=1 Tax=Flavobacterium aquatile LMG 4008 = ATCC 11947 TaxID=1453498 RepID=A0A095SUM5_9FLAO|nr:ATP-binding protein [Flavobacterium aquatile]KGD68307.1 histidine kinase [Flavobacterium aquatile LMG 4008 = ATCC 11947]OXA68759.1 hybrid sensor histidine kinase/response regulator [Flavobacterium aquatile LMG 4008 = ATCC 11947]GEC77212.1 histidine kinase [Flavobacterium aquatile]